MFDADLGDSLYPDVTDLYYLRNPKFTGALVNTDVPGRFVFGTDYYPEKGETVAEFTPERVTELIRIATDLPDLELQIRWIGGWQIAARIAERFSSGRVFLVGDAAKVTPPTGGMGGNTAVGDGHDIAWKLAAVLRGQAGRELLDSYESERRPFAELVVNASLHNMKQRTKPDLDLAGVPEPVDQIEIALGYRCRSAAVLIDDDDPRPTENPNSPSGRPGFRAPHAPLGDGRSTVDLFGLDWVLITTGPDWRAAAEESVITCHEFPADGLLAQRYGLEPGGATLVRPDGVVAWRSPTPVPDPAETLESVLTGVR